MASERRTSRGLAVVLAALAIGAAAYYFAGDACRSSARVDALYAAPVLLAASSFLLVSKGTGRWKAALVLAVVIGVVAAVVLGVLAALHYGLGGCYT